jgi:hypothetical protein
LRIGLWVGVVALQLVSACKKSESTSAAGAAPSGATALGGNAANPSAAPAGAAGEALAGLDECLVGKWKAEKVTLKLDQVNAEGGANTALEISPNGASTIDFSPMNDVHAKANAGFAFDFKYDGKATGNLKTPTRGTIVSDGTNLADLRVTATAKLPGAGAVPLFKDTRVSELASMATAIAGAVPNLPKGANAQPAAAPNPASGIDASPVFSSSRYTCQGDTLTLDNAQGVATWVFKRQS